DRQSFDLKVEAEQQQNRISQTQAVERVWDREINNILIENEFEAIGLQASSERIKQRIAQDLEGNPLFTDDEGNFSEYMLQEYLTNIRTTNPVAYQQFQDYLNSLEITTKQDQLLQLVVGANMPTLAEAEMLYKLENNKRDIQYLQIPYTSIADSTITVSNAEIKAYMEKNHEQYEVEEQRDLEYVFFEEKPSEEDLDAFKSEIAALANDRILDNEITKSKDTLLGLKNTTDYRSFLNTNSDVPFNDNYLFKTQVPTDVAEKVFDMEIGAVYGPYDEGDFIKLTKIVDKRVIPDSVQSAHILVAFRGATRAPAEITRTKEEAKQMADSIYNLVKNNKAKFVEVASDVNTDSTKDTGGDLGWTTYSSKALDPKFADFIYFNPKGSVGVVETSFGYHVV
ncbi:MAG: peptidylprolyl isomerase, partial [Flavobacteriaceae bacterium]|nr:peptidylprolyl isomerase [Flavobacteriaceae bacterium]